jgi:hypothetical protein
MAPFVVRDIPRFRGVLREDAEARRLLLRRLLLVDADFFRVAERLFVREDALRRLPAERFLDDDRFFDEPPDDLERLREDGLFFDAMRFLLVRTYRDGKRRTVGNCVAWA